MRMPNLLPVLIRRRPGRIELTIAPLARGLYAVLGAVLIAVLARDQAGKPFAIMFGVVIALAVLSEDRWVFDIDAGVLRRRSGMVLLAKTWTVPMTALRSIEIDGDYQGGIGPDPYATVVTGSKHDRCAIRLHFDDGKNLVLCSAGQAQLQRLKSIAQTMAQATGLQYIES